MSRSELLLRGRHACRGVILHPELTGEKEARARVLSAWTEGVRLYQLPEGPWLLRFAAVLELRGDHADGVLVVDAPGGGLSAAPSVDADDDEVVYWWGGELRRANVGTLDRLDPSEWLEIPDRVEVLTTPTVNVSARVVEMDAATEPDLRSGAGVSGRSARSKRVAQELAQRQMAERRRGPVTSTPGGGRGKQRRGNDALAKLLLRSPANGVIGRRHQRYLADLESKFTRGDFGEALRHAIPLGGAGGGGLSLRLPTRRNDLRLSGGQTGGGSLPYGPTVHEHLRAVYQDAAKQLEQSGRIDEAAFVLAELLHSPMECVGLLERHGRHRTAAELAEARNLDAALVVRLWWLAGERDRAILMARRTNAFAQVIKHLDGVDPAAATAFRLLWVDQLERSGSYFAAISVGWPDPEIRPALVNVIRRGIELDNEWSLGMRVFRVALQPSADNRDDLVAELFDVRYGESARSFAADALVQAEVPDAVMDREVCSAALRTFVARRVQVKSFQSAVHRIRSRADALLTADLPPAARHPRPSGQIEVPSLPDGARAVLDVVPLQGGRSLVALGEAGLRLLTADGRTAAEWSEPCHRLVASDHDTSVLVLAQRSSVVYARVLDLVTRQMRPYGRVETDLWAKSFDGATWVTRDADGRLVFWDMLAEAPTVAWRELSTGQVCHRIERSTGWLGAIVACAPGGYFTQPRTEVWRWELPRRRLGVRRMVAAVDGWTDVHVLANATSIWERSNLAPLSMNERGDTAERPWLPPSATVRVSGGAVGVLVAGSLRVFDLDRSLDRAQVVWADAGEVSLRAHRNLVAMWNRAGGVATVDLDAVEVASGFAMPA